MRARFLYLITRIRESFWVIPASMSVLAAVLSVATGLLDRGTIGAVLRETSPFVLPVDNARPILSTVAGSMITVASLVFSLTVIALTLAAQQLGPRLVPQFVRDRVTQVVLGAFLATFVYTLLALASLGSIESTTTDATLTVTAAITLALASFGLLVTYIHHLAMSMQADIVIARMASALDGQIERRLPSAEEARDAVAKHKTPPDREGRTIGALGSGYIQSIDTISLLGAATQADALIVVRFRAGKFVCAGEPLAVVFPADADIDDRNVSNAVILGPKRTPTEDLEFELQAIVEIGLRALSPGVNDPFTTLACIDRIGGALAAILQRHLPPHVHRDEEDVARVIVDPITLDGIFDTAFNQIRQAGSGHVTILLRLFETLTRLSHFTRSTEQRDILWRHGQMLERAAAENISEPDDRRALEQRCHALKTSCPESVSYPT